MTGVPERSWAFLHGKRAIQLSSLGPVRTTEDRLPCRVGRLLTTKRHHSQASDELLAWTERSSRAWRVSLERGFLTIPQGTWNQLPSHKTSNLEKRMGLVNSGLVVDRSGQNRRGTRIQPTRLDALAVAEWTSESARQRPVFASASPSPMELKRDRLRHWFTLRRRWRIGQV
jgi:hypothetical protein